MTLDGDLERLLDGWLADGPTVAPDRLLTDITSRIDHQRQRPAWRFPRREPTMTTPFKVALGAAAIVVLFVAGFAVLGPPGGIGSIGPPIASPSPTASPEPLPDGRLDARDYVMRVATGDPMAFTIAAPDGWSGYYGFFMSGPNLSQAPNGVGISVSHNPEVVTDPCDSTVHSPLPEAPTVDGLVAALSARADLNVHGVTDTSLAGYSGKRLDLQLSGDLACGNQYVFAEPKGIYANGPANRWRMWILDVGGESAVVILLDYAATPAADRAAAQAAIDSIRITR